MISFRDLLVVNIQQKYLLSLFFKENIKGDWINEIVFYYQNEKIGEYDHISLSGTIKRIKFIE